MLDAEGRGFQPEPWSLGVGGSPPGKGSGPVPELQALWDLHSSIISEQQTLPPDRAVGSFPPSPLTMINVQLLHAHLGSTAQSISPAHCLALPLPAFLFLMRKYFFILIFF